jgi:tetratricopeptide (TPR) repeat protein
MKKNLGTLLFCLLLFTGVYAQTEASFLKDAKTAENNKEYKQAVSLYKKAIAINPKNSTTYYDIAWCQNELKQYSDAFKFAESGLKISPTAKLYNESAYALYMLDRYTESIEKYKKSLVIAGDEDNLTAVKGIADVYFTQKDYVNAEINYKKCLEFNKEPAIANYKLGYIMNDKGKYQKAVEYLLASVKIDEDYASAYNELGYAYDKLDRISLALDNYLKAYNLNPKIATYAANVASVYFAVSDYEDLDKALEYYKKSVDIDDKNAKSNYRIGWILNDKAKYIEAKSYLNRAVEIDPSYSEAWIELGWIEFSDGNNAIAESDFLKALQFSSKSELARYYLGQVYIKQGKKSKAQKMIDELKSMDSKYAKQLEDKM